MDSFSKPHSLCPPLIFFFFFLHLGFISVPPVNAAMADNETDDSQLQVLHKKCGEKLGEGYGLGFVETREAAFVSLEKCIIMSDRNNNNNNDNRMCDMMSYESSMHLMGQCEENLGDCECGECVNNAFQIARDECGGYSVSAEVYLNGCYISFAYDPSHGLFEEQGEGGTSGKLVALVIGGIVALFFGLVFLLFIKREKSDD